MYRLLATLEAKIGSAAVRGLSRLAPNSDGMIRWIPATMAASMMRFWKERASAPRVIMRAWFPQRLSTKAGIDW